MKIDQEEEEDLLKTAVFYCESGVAPPWCVQDLKIHIFKDIKL
jgi:hypothetical protein